MYGWRAKIGLITPMSENAEHAFHIHAPQGVTFASTKINFPGPTPEGLRILVSQLEATAAQYRNYPLDLVVFGCTSGSFIEGVGFDKELIARIERASGAPGLTTSTAILDALDALESRRVAVLTPYPDDTNEIERRFFEDNGFTVTSIAGMDMRDYSRPASGFENAPEEFLLQQSVEFDLAGADTFFLSCMGLTTIEVLPRIEDALGVPVITSHQATLWSALRHVGVNDPLPGLGALGER